MELKYISKILSGVRDARTRREGNMEAYVEKNKQAWEFNAYEFWLRANGAPEELAHRALTDPHGMLRRHARYFDGYRGVKVANICGSCGKKALALAVLGAEVTVFDISRDNQRYAIEAARAAGVSLGYEVCDVLGIDRERFGGRFDVVFMEGGVLHYFHDIDRFMGLMRALLRKGGRMICSDFHPLTKIADVLGLEQPAQDYFSQEVFEGEMAHARFFDEETRQRMPKCSYRKYTLSEIINAVIGSGLRLERFDEHPAWQNARVPGEFTLVASRSEAG